MDYLTGFVTPDGQFIHADEDMHVLLAQKLGFQHSDAHTPTQKALKAGYTRIRHVVECGGNFLVVHVWKLNRKILETIQTALLPYYESLGGKNQGVEIEIEGEDDGSGYGNGSYRISNLGVLMFGSLDEINSYAGNHMVFADLEEGVTEKGFSFNPQRDEQMFNPQINLTKIRQIAKRNGLNLPDSTLMKDYLFLKQEIGHDFENWFDFYYTDLRRTAAGYRDVLEQIKAEKLVASYHRNPDDSETVSVVVKRCPRFQDTGEYIVTIDNQIEHRIFRDGESGYWYCTTLEGSVHSSSSYKFLGFNKKEALQRLLELEGY